MKKYFFIILLFVSAVGNAQVPQLKRSKVAAPQKQLQVFIANPELRYERANSQELVGLKPTNLALAFRSRDISFLLEYSKLSDQTGNMTSSIGRDNESLMIVFREHFLVSRNQNINYSMFWGVGAGLFRDQVTTTIFGLSRIDKSDPQMMGSLSFGSDLAFSLTRNFDFILAAEGKSLVASNFDPNPVWSASARFGIVLRY